MGGGIHLFDDPRDVYGYLAEAEREKIEKESAICLLSGKSFFLSRRQLVSGRRQI